MGKKDYSKLQIGGRLNFLEHVWEKGIFKESVIHILDEGGTNKREFYAFIPESMLGKKVTFDQEIIRNTLLQRLRLTKGTLFQKLTLQEGDENDANLYHIVTYSKKFIKDFY